MSAPRDLRDFFWGGPGGWLLRVGVTIGLGAYLLFTTEIGAVSDALRRVQWPLLVLAIVLYAGDRLLAALKWKILFDAHEERSKGGDLGLFRAFSIYLQSSFLGSTLPATVGVDAIRSGLVRREAGSYSYAISSVVAERLLGTLSLVVCALVGILYFAAGSNWTGFEVGIVPLIAVASILLVAAILLLVPVRDAQDDGGGLWSRILAFFAETQSWIRRYQDEPRAVGASFGLALAQQYLFVTINWLLALGLGLAVPFLEMIWIWPLIMIAVRLPISLLGFGVREALLVKILDPGGIGAGGAVSLGLLSGFLDLLFVAIGGVLVALGRNSGVVSSDADVVEVR